MSASEKFAEFNTGLPETIRQTMRQLIADNTQELLAARSEDARMRIVERYLKDVQTLTQGRK